MRIMGFKRAVAVVIAMAMSVAAMPAVDVTAANEPNTPTATTASDNNTTIVLTIGSTTYTVNGVASTSVSAPVIIGGSTMTPARLVAEALGASVDWDGNTQRVTIVGHNAQGQPITAVLIIGSTTYTVNGIAYQASAAPVIVGGSTMTPARLVAELLGASVDWDGNTQRVTITRSQAEQVATVPPATTAPVATTPPTGVAVQPPIVNDGEWPDVLEFGTTDWPEFRPTIPIPNRHLTLEERDAWIANYELHGGPFDFELEHIRLLNELRASLGLSILEPHTALMMSARFMAQSMHDLDFFGHDHPVYGGGLFSSVLFGFGGFTENIATSPTPLRAFENFYNSPSHRQNMLNPAWNTIGVGFFDGYWAAQYSVGRAPSVVRVLEQHGESPQVGTNSNISFTFEANGLPDGHFMVSFQEHRDFDLGVTIRPVTDSTGEIGVVVRDSIRVRPDDDDHLVGIGGFMGRDHIEIRDGIGTIILHIDATTDSAVSGSGLVDFAIMQGINNTWWIFEEAVEAAAWIPIFILP